MKAIETKLNKAGGKKARDYIARLTLYGVADMSAPQKKRVARWLCDLSNDVLKEDLSNNFVARLMLPKEEARK